MLEAWVALAGLGGKAPRAYFGGATPLVSPGAQAEVERWFDAVAFWPEALGGLVKKPDHIGPDHDGAVEVEGGANVRPVKAWSKVVPSKVARFCARALLASPLALREPALSYSVPAEALARSTA